MNLPRLIKKLIPINLKNVLKSYYYYFLNRNKPKYFCISIQKSGTTSVGDFFKLFGYKVSNYSIHQKRCWNEQWFDGNYDIIFNSLVFKANQVFEDDPWWLPEFYKIIFHKIPNSKFILFYRDSEKWFKSMSNHSNGKTLGNTKIHCKMYRREFDLYNLKLNQINIEEDNLLSLDGYEKHYRNIYEIHNREVIDFFKFHNPNALFTCSLDDPDKWKKLGDFMGFRVPEIFDIHANKTINY